MIELNKLERILEVGLFFFLAILYIVDVYINVGLIIRLLILYAVLS